MIILGVVLDLEVMGINNAMKCMFLLLYELKNHDQDDLASIGAAKALSKCHGGTISHAKLFQAFLLLFLENCGTKFEV